MKYIRYILVNAIFLIILSLIIFFSYKEIKLNRYLEKQINKENHKLSNSKIEFEEQIANREVVETINIENKFRELTRDEKLAKALKTSVEDDIWFWGTHSNFYEYINETMEYEFEFEVYHPYSISDKFEEEAHVLPTKENIPYLSDNVNGFYDLLELPLNNGEFTNEVYISSGSQDYEELKRKMPDPEGIGKIEIGEIRKPTYDISEERMQESVAKIMEYFNKHNNREKTYSTVYIRYFYEFSEYTIIIYSNDKERFFANVDVNGDRIYKPTPVADEVLEEDDYVNRLIECSYLVKQ